MIGFYDLVETIKLESIASKLKPTALSDWYWFCRQYSQKFYTPLHQVMEMSPEVVVRAVFDSQLDDLKVDENIDSIMDMVYQIEDPEYDSKKEKDLEDFIAQAEAEEEERVLEGRPVYSGPSNESSLPGISVPKKQKSVDENLPTGGSIDLSYLADQDREE